VAAALSNARFRRESGEAVRSPSVAESELMRLALSLMLRRLWTNRCSGTSSKLSDVRLEWVAKLGSVELSVSLRYARFFPEWRNVRRLCKGCTGVTMTMASTTVDVDDVELRFFSEGLVCSQGVFSVSVGQPIDLANFSMEDDCGLSLLASTRSRKLELRRGVELVAGGTGSVEARFFCGDFFGLRFLRTVTFRIKLVSHSRNGLSSMSRIPLLSSSRSLRLGSSSKEAVSEGTSIMVFLGVDSSPSCSKASPNPRSSSTTLNRAARGVVDRLSASDDAGSSLAVVKDSARDEG